MPEREGPIGNVDVRELPIATLSNLVGLAREAYGQGRTKDCLDLTRAILLTDPENPEAHLMRSAIRTEMHQNLESAQALLRSAQTKDTTPQSTPVETEAIPVELHFTDSECTTPAAVPVPIDDEPVDSPVSEKTVVAPSRSRRARWLKRAGVVVFLGGLAVAGFPSLKSRSSFVQVPVLPVLQAYGPSPILNAVPARPEALPATAATSADASLKVNHVVPPVDAPLPPSSPNLRERPSALVASGTLAISSPTSVDIYMDDLYVGSAPVSLEISAGMHTLEYRHGNLRKKVVHVIQSNETTRAMITFDVTVQINAKPWADVFLDGIDRKPLGQTPLSDVRAPIGAVLVFENPGFQTKRYRVTGNETGIQIVFP